MRVRYRARRRIGPFAINIAPGRGMLPRVSSVAIKVGPFTRNLTRGTTSINTPGLGSVQLDSGRSRRPGRRQYPPGTDAVAVAEIECRGCHMRPLNVCETAQGRPAARPHKLRRDDAADLIEHRRDGGPRRGPVRLLVGRVLGWLAVVVLAWLLALYSGAGSGLDLIRWEIGL